MESSHVVMCTPAQGQIAAQCSAVHFSEFEADFEDYYCLEAQLLHMQNVVAFWLHILHLYIDCFVYIMKTKQTDAL